jgi:uncharacterized protein YuzE
VVPLHRRDLAVGTLASVLRQAGVDPETFIQALWSFPLAMKICYFPDTDTLTIELADRVSSSSEAVSDNLIVDFDELGQPVGVTLEHYSQISDSSAIETLLPITPVLQPA